jgi:hypothetical protein
MITLYYENEMAQTIEDIKDYISQCPTDEQSAYLAELNEVKGDFVALCESGVFHDACGECIGIKSDGLFWFAEVETEY